MKKYLKTVIFFLLCLFAFTSCKKSEVKETDVSLREQADVTEVPLEKIESSSEPEETVASDKASKSETNQTQESNNQSLLGVSGYVNLNNAADNAESVMKEKYKNITFNKDLEIEVPEEAGQYEFEQTSTFNEDGESVPKYFLGDKFNRKCLEEQSSEDSADTDSIENSKDYLYIDSVNGFEVYTQENGLLYYLRNSNDYLWMDYCRNTSPIFLDSSYDKKTSYLVSDGKMTIPEVIKAGQEFVTKFTNQYGDMAWKPYIIYMKENEDGTYGFVLYFLMSYNGVDFCPLQDYIYSEMNDFQTAPQIGKEYYSTYVYINSTKEISGFENELGFLKKKETKKAYDQVISFERATEIVDKNIQDNTCNNIIDAKIEYWFELEQYDENVEFDCFNGGNILKTRPYWVFYMGDSKSEGPVSCITVDCITGQCYQVADNKYRFNQVTK